jgi:hypothetical protein
MMKIFTLICNLAIHVVTFKMEIYSVNKAREIKEIN